MRWIYSKFFLYAVGCAAIIAILLAFQVRGWLNPLRWVVANIVRPVSIVAQHTIAPAKGFFVTVVSLRSIVSENTALHQQVQNLEQQLVELQQLRQENEGLRKDLGFARAAAYQLQPCTVLALDPQEVAETFTLNCGERQGLRAGQAVVAEGYLIGRIVYAGPLVSTGTFITNSQSSIDARVGSQISGVIKGSFGSGLVLDQVAQNADIHSGDLVVTAGIAGSVPKNILIGQIGSVISQSTDLFRRANVTSPIDFHNVNYVFVVKQ